MEERNIERRQLLSLGVLLFLAPALRLFPAEAAASAGRAAWLTPLAALPMLLFYAAFLTKLLSLRREGEALPELLGRVAGWPALALTSLWLLLYTAFVLRAGADRFVGTIYPRASYAVFAEIMGALALAGALAGPRALARVGRMLLPFVLGILLLLLAISLRTVRLDNLWPLYPRDLPGLARGALAPLDVAAGAAAALCFPARAGKHSPHAQRTLTLWMAALCALLTLLALAVTGSLGHELTSELSRPFFVLVRTLTFFRTVERVEALVVMLWIFPDFLTASLFLWAFSQCLYRLLGGGEEGSLAARAGLKTVSPLIWLGAPAAVALSLFLAPDARRLERWSQALIPACNLLFCFVLLPAVYGLAKWKEKKKENQ